MGIQRVSRIGLIAFFTCFLCFGQIVAAKADSAVSIETITPPDVLVHAARVRAELELIRYFMGKPLSREQDFAVNNVAPREVFFQALTMYQKANRFSFEQARLRGTEPETPTGVIRPGHVYEVVDAALQLVLSVKAKLGIDEKIAEPIKDSSKQPADVFRSIVQSNRQLNILLERSFAPKDVYQRVSYAMSYTAELLSQFPGENRIPEIEPLEQGTRPGDVYRRLITCFDLIRDIGKQSGLVMLDFDTNRFSSDNAIPSDVYDIASLVVSELAYLHATLADAKPPRAAYNPGRKFPSHVFQRVSGLESLLHRLTTRVDKYPQWLSHKQAGL